MGGALGSNCVSELVGKEVRKRLVKLLSSPLAGEEAVVCDAKRALQMQERGTSSRKVTFTLAEGATHVDTYNGKREIAFTLSEVLITLGIIGVVAALTLPSVITKYRKYVLLNKIKHTYTLLNNTLERAKADYGTDINQWELSEGTKLDKSTFFVENYILPYLNVLQYCGRSYTKQGCFEQAKRLKEGVANISPMSSNYGTSFILNRKNRSHKHARRNDQDCLPYRPD